MSDFTTSFFANTNNTKKTTSKTTNNNFNKTINIIKSKKEEDEEKEDFTSNYFKSYNDEEEINQYDEDFINDYNTFINGLNETSDEYYNLLYNIEAEKAQKEYDKAQNKINHAAAYYDKNKETLREERHTNLIYNWDLKKSGGSEFDYGAIPIQDENGYFKKVDNKGNVYWSDDLNNKLYDSNYNLLNYDMINLKYEYDKNSKSILNKEQLNNAEKLALTPIDESQYSFLATKEVKVPKKYENYYFYYEQMQNGTNNLVPNFNNSNSQFFNNYDIVNNKNETTTKTVDNSKEYNTYKRLFDELNNDLSKGHYTAANNKLESINKQYFGYAYSDHWIDTIISGDSDDSEFLQNRFNENVTKLELINNSLANTNDAETLQALREEKNRLEFENTLIQYNRICSINSINNLTEKVNNIQAEADEAWKKTGQSWASTFDEFDDGYQFGDIFKTIGKTFHNEIQTLGAAGKQVNATFQEIETIALSDLDESTFKDTWGPAIIDVSTYVIPYVGQARFIYNLLEPSSVVEAGLTRQGSVTIHTTDGEMKTPDILNIGGASANIIANFLSNLIFSKIRGRFTGEQIEEFYKQSGKNIFREITKEAIGEGGEEFIQTYAEYMQNMDDEKMSWNFFVEHYDEALKSALVASVTAGGASGASIAIGSIRGNNINIEKSGDAVDNIRVLHIVNDDVKINSNVKENSNKTIYSVNNTKNYENIKYKSKQVGDVKLEFDEDASVNIASQLQNGNIITLLNSDSVKSNTKDIDLDSNTSIKLSDSIINDNIKTVLVPSKEMETYLKNIRDDLAIYTIDPKSDTLINDVKEYLTDVNKSNIVTKNVSDFIPNKYVFSPDEMVEINNIVNESINKGNLLDNINNPDVYKLNPITVSDITDSDINTIMNSIKDKFLNEISNNKISKETAQKEFKSLANKLSDYAIKTKDNRTYIKDNKGSIITFTKKGSNIYEAVDSLPYSDTELEVFANVKTNGNIINGNLNQKVKFAKKQLNALNNLIDKLGLKGNYITQDSTYKDISSLLHSNLEFSKEILQSLGVDGLLDGKAKTRLYTAYDNLDNANMNGAVENTIRKLKDENTIAETIKKSETEAPSVVKIPGKPSEISIEEKPLSVEKYATNPENPSELNNIELEKLLDDSFKDLEIKNKLSKTNVENLKALVKNAVLDGYSHIADIANINEDYNVKKAIYDMQAVASDAQTMITGAQMNNGEVIGKSLKQIYSDNNIKSKKNKELFEKTMLHALNAEREKAGVEKIFENISAKQSEAIVNKLFDKHPNFKNAALDLQRYNNNLLDMLVENGVVSKQLSDVLKSRYKYYMPIYSSDLSTFADLGSEKYFKSLSLDNSIKDVTKTSKQILSLQKSMENKTYNVLSAIAKNKLAQEISKNNNYIGDSDLIYYDNGQITKTKVSKDVLYDITNNTASHIADTIHDLPVFKQAIDLSNMSYKFILDPIYQVKNITIDFTDSALIYSKDKAHFVPNYFKAIHAVANNSELFHEALNNGLGNIGEGWTAPKVSYDSDGNIITKQNKFQRVYANLEAMPKLAEYISLKEKYMKQARADYDAGKYKIIDNHLAFNDDEQYAINNWVGAESYTINEHYRYGYDIDDRLQNISDNMDSVLNKIKSESGTFNRSITLEGDKLQDFINKYQKGKIVKEDAFTSISKDIVYDDSFNVQMEIKSNNAKDTTKLMRADENEYMLKRGSEFKVDDIEINGDNIKVKLTDVTEDTTTLYKNNISFSDIQEKILNRAMIDASDVNLNFNRGGKVTKALSKSGFKFLNAGIQGFDKFVTHVGDKVKTPKGMGSLLLEFTAVGVTTAVANQILNGDDEDYDKLPYYYKNNYYMFKVGDNKFFRVPKGRVQSLYNVLFEYSTGLRKEDSAKDYIDSLHSAFEMAVLPPALENASPISMYVQLFNNKDAFGNEIYSNKYDSTSDKFKKSAYHLLSNYFGRYGRIVKDVTDGDNTTDLFNEFDFYKDTTKANRHYSTVLNLVEYYQNKNNVKTLDDRIMKKYIDTQNYNLRTINSEINQGKQSGQTTKDLSIKYAARDDLLNSIINNYKNFDKETLPNGNIIIYFDDLTFTYNPNTDKITKNK